MHYVDPRLERAHVAILYRNFQAKHPHYSHIGLGVNALHTARVLHRHRIQADVFGVWEPKDVARVLTEKPTVSHCLIEALWVGTAELGALMMQFPHVHFLVRAHSEVGFLQVEPGAITMLREQMLLADQYLNLTVAANSHRLVDFLRATYDSHVLYLPNLYDVERVDRRRGEPHQHRLLRIGSFGALRWLKNHTTAAAVALTIARQRGCDLEFWLSVDREEHGKSVLQAVRNLFVGLPWAQLHEEPWAPWASFRRTIRAMDLALQPSFTETFNLVTADAVAAGVPAVVSHAVEWAPAAWKAHPDEIHEMARIGSMLLASPTSADEGLRALQRYLDEAVTIWKGYLSDDPSRIHH
jgi:glycosyltransferase involved in cell wall biosynthesis